MDEEPRERERLDVSLLRATPTLARLAAGASVRTAQWGLATSVRVSTRLIRAAARGESPSELVQEEHAEDFLRLVPHATYVDVGGARHMVAGDRNDQFAKAIEAFLRKIA